MSRLANLVLDALGTCPYDQFGIEPHESPCEQCCQAFANNIDKCWDAWNEMEQSDDS